ncbi:MAG: cupin domain-containing protein [Bifidobacteriaceae bacterium]|jgi:hypothetical protein|nr:cupin domain-containing protein [Bifidobacteriaceae bacterium]
MHHQFDRGWQRYGFDNQEFRDAAIHGASWPISLTLAFNRGLWQPHISFSTITPGSPGQAIGMHVHRDVPTGKDVEEWYIIIDGRGEMTFSNGDVVEGGPGDMIAIWPETGHSFRAIGDKPLRMISITPKMFSYPNPEGAHDDPWPDEFHPQIKVLDVDEQVVAVNAVCATCGARWERPADDKEAASLPVWARQHRHDGADRP